MELIKLLKLNLDQLHISVVKWKKEMKLFKWFFFFLLKFLFFLSNLNIQFNSSIFQVNYQTVVGWERKNLLELFRESPAEVLLTLKRRPRHTKVYGQIYIKPYRLPSNKKTSYTTRWQHNLPSPRPELLTIPDFTMPLPRCVFMLMYIFIFL